MRPGVIVSVSQLCDKPPSEEAEVGGLRSPLQRLSYCIEELDKEVLALSRNAPCETVLAARHEIAALRSLVSHLSPTSLPQTDKSENYSRVIQELMEERERLELEIAALDLKERETKISKGVSPVSGTKNWQEDFDDI